MAFVGFKSPRVHNADHLDFIRQLPCACCGNPFQTEAAHIRTESQFHGKSYTGKGEKPSDIWAVPLCNAHHTEQHKGNELAFWRLQGIDPFVLALSLAACSGDHPKAEEVLRRQRISQKGVL